MKIYSNSIDGTSKIFSIQPRPLVLNRIHNQYYPIFANEFVDNYYIHNISKHEHILVHNVSNIFQIFITDTRNYITSYLKHKDYLIIGYANSLIGINDPSDFMKSQNKRILLGHEGPITCLKLIDRYGILISGSVDKTVKLWNINTSKCLYTFNGHNDSILTIDAKIEGDYIIIITGSADKSIIIWKHIYPQQLINNYNNTFNNTQDNTFESMFTQMLQSHNNNVTALAIDYSYDNILYSGSSDHTIKKWYFGNLGNPLLECKWHINVGAPVTKLHVKNRYLLIGLNDGWIVIYDTMENKEITRYKGHQDEIDYLRIVTDQKWYNRTRTMFTHLTSGIRKYINESYNNYKIYKRWKKDSIIELIPEKYKCNK